MSSTDTTEPAAASEQPARSPAKAQKYNFGKPGGHKRSRRNSLEHKTGNAKPGKHGGGEHKPLPEIRYEPVPLLPTGKYPGQEKERRGVIAWFFRAMGCVLNAAVVAAIVLRMGLTPHSGRQLVRATCEKVLEKQDARERAFAQRTWALDKTQQFILRDLLRHEESGCYVYSP